MLLMMAEVLHLTGIYREHFKGSGLWAFLSFHQDHVPWIGCSLHDLIQPSFSFLVGAALPFSLARRNEEGESFWMSTLHAFGRALILVFLGVFLRSFHTSSTNWTFEDTLSQIGLGYGFLYLTAFAPRAAQWGIFATLCIGTWLAFVLYPLPGLDFDWKGAGLTPQPEVREVIVAKDDHGRSLSEFLAATFPIDDRRRPLEPIDLEDVEVNGARPTNAHVLAEGEKVVVRLRDAGQLKGALESHFNKNTNLAWAFDKWFLNLFPRPEGKEFIANRGGYATLSFIPTLATMILGLFAGQKLKEESSASAKITWLIAAGAICLIVGWLLGAAGVCPVVKRIWTPSWVLFSGGWCFFFTAAFYAVTDVGQYRGWAFPLIVVGMNSIAAYLIAHGIDGFIEKTLPKHLGESFFLMWGEPLRPLVMGLCVLLCEWLILFYMYRQKIFIRI